MRLRLEEPKDRREVENLTREAFWNKYRFSFVSGSTLGVYYV